MNTIAIYPAGIVSETYLKKMFLIAYETRDTIWDFLEQGLQPCYIDLTGETTLINDLSSGWLSADCTLFEIFQNATDSEFRSYSALPTACSWPFGRPSLALGRIYKRITVWDHPELVLTPDLVKSFCRQVLRQSKRQSNDMPLSDQIILCYQKIKFRMIRFGLDYHLISGKCLMKDLFLCQLLTAQCILVRQRLKCEQRFAVIVKERQRKETQETLSLIERERERMALGLPLDVSLFIGNPDFLRCWLDTKWTKDWPTIQESIIR
ncbi:nonstructural protein [Khasan virus]|nr:nonstructural protein [Khasan virus]